ncbi:MAG: hypothetical protein IJW86_07240 [Clostridia bacterium]|nr:hypothetical protein [Clostridia bacterium]
MDIIKEWLSNYGGEVLLGVITAVVTFLGTAIKKILKQWADSKEKRQIVKDVVKAVEQMYKNLHGTDKLKKAMKTASDMLSEKGITITELELMTLIEAAVSDFNDAFNKTSWKQGIEDATDGDEYTAKTEEGDTVEEDTVSDTAEAVG